MAWSWAASCRNRGQPGPQFPKRRRPRPKLMCLRRRLDEIPTSERLTWPGKPHNIFRHGSKELDSSSSTERSSPVMLSAAKHLAADGDRPFAEFTLSEAKGSG